MMMLPDWAIGGSLLLNFVAGGFAFCVYSSVAWRRRLAAMLWASAKAKLEIERAKAGIQTEQARYETELMQRGEPASRLAVISTSDTNLDAGRLLK